MAIVCETSNFTIVTPEQPHIARGDGGHLIINPKVTVEDRTCLSRELAIELMKLTMVAGSALKTVLTRQGIEIGRINYQDNGNWRHELHVHIYGRARNSKIQRYGSPVAFPPTAQAFRETMGNLEPLQSDDIAELKAEIGRLLASDKYRDF